MLINVVIYREIGPLVLHFKLIWNNLKVDNVLDITDITPAAARYFQPSSLSRIDQQTSQPAGSGRQDSVLCLFIGVLTGSISVI